MTEALKSCPARPPLERNEDLVDLYTAILDSLYDLYIEI